MVVSLFTSGDIAVTCARGKARDLLAEGAGKGTGAVDMEDRSTKGLDCAWGPRGMGLLAAGGAGVSRLLADTFREEGRGIELGEYAAGAEGRASSPPLPLGLSAGA
jgi:hypothetical protein